MALISISKYQQSIALSHPIVHLAGRHPCVRDSDAGSTERFDVEPFNSCPDRDVRWPMAASTPKKQPRETPHKALRAPRRLAHSWGGPTACGLSRPRRNRPPGDGSE